MARRNGPGAAAAAAVLLAAACVGASLAAAQGNEPGPPPTPATPDGAALFVTVGCALCHGAAGEGRRLAPALAGNTFTAGPGNLVSQILMGSGSMPPFRNRLSDAEIAAIADFVRMVLNPYTDPVPPALVAALR